MWCATWTLRASRWGRRSFLRGRYPGSPPAFPSSVSPLALTSSSCLQVPVPFHGAAGRHAPQRGAALWVSPPQPLPLCWGLGNAHHHHRATRLLLRAEGCGWGLLWMAFMGNGTPSSRVTNCALHQVQVRDWHWCGSWSLCAGQVCSESPNPMPIPGLIFLGPPLQLQELASCLPSPLPTFSTLRKAHFSCVPPKKLTF